MPYCSKDPTGLTHLGAREYDPTTGRFISIDPIMDLTDPQQWHAYTYSRNSPITFSDPSGLIDTCDNDGNATCASSPRPSNELPTPDDTYVPDPDRKPKRRIFDSPGDYCKMAGAALLNCAGHVQLANVRLYDLGVMRTHIDDVMRIAALVGIDARLLMAIMMNENVTAQKVGSDNYTDFKVFIYDHFGWYKDAGPSIGLGRMKQATFEDTKCRNPELAGVEWMDIANDRQLAMFVTALQLKDLDKALKGGESFTNKSGTFTRNEMLAYGYNAGMAYMTSASDGSSMQTEYVEIYRDHFARANRAYCMSGLFICA